MPDRCGSILPEAVFLYKSLIHTNLCKDVNDAAGARQAAAVRESFTRALCSAPIIKNNKPTLS